MEGLNCEPNLRIWWIPQLGMQGSVFHVPVDTLQAARLLLNTLAEYDLHLERCGLRGDYSNIGGLEEDSSGEWLEWETEEGEDIWAYSSNVEIEA